jgi:dTDP-4-amino-4,6-dideoxygalactose transaminase
LSHPPRVPFNLPVAVGTEFDYVAEAIANGQLSSDGEFTARCADLLREETGARLVLLTHSCTAALEMSVMLAEVSPGDEVIMPSFTFVSTASSVVMRGGVPVFVDVRPDTLNLDEALVGDAITSRTKAIFPVHYAGVGCEMDAILDIASGHGLVVLEDAAQGLMASYRGTPLGAIGDLGALSFHETKNVTCGEGGALMVNDDRFVERANLLRDKGTNRKQFFRGEVDRYTWVDLGSSYGLGELNAAFLWGQLEQRRAITRRRLKVWGRYHAAFGPLEDQGLIRRPVVPDDRLHNAHLYYLLVPDRASRDRLLAELEDRGVYAVFHYVPLHSAPAGRRYGRTHGTLDVTDDVSGRLVRLPLWAGMTDEQVDHVIASVTEVLASLHTRSPSAPSISPR